jgi:hypothetical protein
MTKREGGLVARADEARRFVSLWEQSHRPALRKLVSAAPASNELVPSNPFGAACLSTPADLFPGPALLVMLERLEEDREVLLRALARDWVLGALHGGSFPR